MVENSTMLVGESVRKNCYLYYNRLEPLSVKLKKWKENIHETIKKAQSEKSLEFLEIHINDINKCVKFPLKKL